MAGNTNHPAQNNWQTTQGQDFLQLTVIGVPGTVNPVGGIDSTGTSYGTLAAGSGGGGGSFATITGGTNINALVVGSGGSLSVSGTGTITATNGVTFVSSLPATCTPGTTQPVSLTVAPFGVYFCNATNNWALIAPASGIVYASSYGAQGKWQVESTGANFTVTSGSNVVTCTTCKFQTSTFHVAQVGDELFATNWGGSDGSYSSSVAVIGLGSAVPITITSVDSDTQVHISANAGGNAGTTNGSVGTLAWGPDDTAAIHAAKLAAFDGLNCQSVQLPGPFTNLNSPEFNTASCRGVSGGSTASKYTGIIGQNPSGNTTILLPPWFGLGSLAGCNGAVSGIACFGGAGGISNITFNGLGQSSFALGAHNILENVNDVSWYNVYCWGFAANVPNTIGIVFNTGIHLVQNVISDGCGATPIQVNGKVHPAYSLEALNGTSNVGTLVVNSGGYLSCFNCNVQPDASAGNGITANGASAIYEGYADSLFGLPYVGNCWAALNGGTVHIHGGICLNNGGATNATAISTTGSSFVTIDNSTVAGGATSGAFQITAGTEFHFGLGNKITANGFGNAVPTCAFTTGGGAGPSCAIQAGSTNESGVIIATTGTTPGSQGTVTLSFAGTFTGATGAVPSCTFTLDNSGTTWGAEAVVFANTQSTTAPTLAWTNVAAVTLTALTASSPYRIAYTCWAR